MVPQFDATSFLEGLFGAGLDAPVVTPQPEAPADAQAEAAPERFRPFAVDAAGNVRYLDDDELSTWLADCRREPAEDSGTAEASGDSPSARWASAEEPGDGCPRCGSLAAWWSLIDTRRCLNCEPPRPDAEAIRAKAARIRQQTAKWRD